MSSGSLIVARKEMLDHLRDSRSLASAALYTLMGPIIVGMVLVARSDGGNQAASSALPLMASVFALMAAFSGCMSLAMDTVAGERERRSLLPLLLSTASRMDVVLGKWLAASVFAGAGVLVNVIAFVAVLSATSVPTGSEYVTGLLVLMPSLVVLSGLVAALEVLASTMCRSVKEAQTWLSIVIFGAMGVGMFVAYRPDVLEGVWYLLPIVGQQKLLHAAFSGTQLPMMQIAALNFVSGAVTVLVLARIGKLFHRDEIIYSA